MNPPLQQVINLAVQHHSDGRLAEADAIYREILHEDANQPVALHLSGLIAHQKGDQDTAVALIQRAIEVNPAYFEAHVNLCAVLKGLARFDEAILIYRQALSINPQAADVSYDLGLVLQDTHRLEEAIAAYKRAIEIKPDYFEAHNNLANIYKKLNRFARAESHYRKALTIETSTAELHANLGNMLVKLGRLEEAVAAYRQAIALNPAYVDAHYGLGIALQNAQNWVAAIAAFEDAVALNPTFYRAYNRLGVCEHECGHFDQAIARYQMALEAKPEFSEAHVNLGNSLKSKEKFEDAISHYEKAIELDPGFAIAYDNLCEVLEKTNKVGALRETINRAKLNCKIAPRLTLREAQVLKRDGDYLAARNLLEAQGEIAENARFKSIREQLLGDLCDRLDDPKAAFDRFKKSNALSRKMAEGTSVDGRKYLARIEELANCFTPEWVAGWNNLKAVQPPHAPVFLVGFPRSGTTLMEAVLGSHKSVHVVGESAVVTQTLKAARRMLGRAPQGLAGMSKAQQQELQGVYLSGLAEQAGEGASANVVIDKMPLNLVEAGLIHRVFPDARFLFVLRHPCDCVLSCFMQNFELNDAMSNFLDLQDAAHLYDRTMTLWEQFQQLLPMQVETIRYESLLTDFDETLKPVLGFLELEWDEGVRDYAQRAKHGKIIRTPSYNQVTQPIYRRAENRWRRYKSEMEDVLPILQPWIDQYDYNS